MECTQFDAVWRRGVAATSRATYNKGWSNCIGGRNVREASEAEAATRAQSAARGPEVSGKHSGQAVAHSGGIYQSAGAIEMRRNRRHHCDVWLGANSFARRYPGAAGTFEKTEGGQGRVSQDAAQA